MDLGTYYFATTAGNGKKITEVDWQKAYNQNYLEARVPQSIYLNAQFGILRNYKS